MFSYHRGNADFLTSWCASPTISRTPSSRLPRLKAPTRESSLRRFIPSKSLTSEKENITVAATTEASFHLATGVKHLLHRRISRSGNSKASSLLSSTLSSLFTQFSRCHTSKVNLIQKRRRAIVSKFPCALRSLSLIPTTLEITFLHVLIHSLPLRCVARCIVDIHRV